MTRNPTPLDDWTSDARRAARRWRGKFVWLNSGHVGFDSIVQMARGSNVTVETFDLKNCSSFYELVQRMRARWPGEGWLSAHLDAFRTAVGILVDDAIGEKLCLAFDAAEMPGWSDDRLASVVEILQGEVTFCQESSRKHFQGGVDEGGSFPCELTVLWRSPVGQLPTPFRPDEAGATLTSAPAMVDKCAGGPMNSCASLHPTSSNARHGRPSSLPVEWIDHRAATWCGRFVWLNPEATPRGQLPEVLRRRLGDVALLRSRADSFDAFVDELRRAHPRLSNIGDNLRSELIRDPVGVRTTILVDASEMHEWVGRHELICSLQDAVDSVYAQSDGGGLTVVWIDSPGRMPNPFDDRRAVSMVQHLPNDSFLTLPWSRTP